VSFAGLFGYATAGDRDTVRWILVLMDEYVEVEEQFN